LTAAAAHDSLCAMSALLLPLLLTATQSDAEALERGRAATALFFSADPAPLADTMTPDMLAAVGGRDGVGRLAAEVERIAGREAEVLRESGYREEDFVSYYRQSRFDRAGSVTVNWVFAAADGRIGGASVAPSVTPAATPHEGRRTRAKLRLPFGRPADGGWYVSWGGRDAVSNYHVIAADQRFASDYLLTGNGRFAANGGRRNEDHYCWNQPVLAPAGGRIVSAVGDIADNPSPSVVTPGVPAPGNHVVIAHGKTEHSLIAHFRQGTLAVRVGQKVRAGQLLGLCGNSGNSSQPHVHYHLQTGRSFGEGLGLPAFFNRYEADGVPVERGEPQRGQVVVPAAD
jgi:murein DD-endopeptidase MepM/ murein hydrolase activator NlpD